MSRRLTNFIAATVTTVWAVSFVADIALHTYEPSPFIHLAMMAVIGAAFGSSMLKPKGGAE